MKNEGIDWQSEGLSIVGLDPAVPVQNGDDPDAKRQSPLLRFGKRQQSPLLRFGKRQSPLVRFGKRSEDEKAEAVMLHDTMSYDGKRQAANILRFG